MIRRWWTTQVQSWKIVPIAFLISNLVLGAAWGFIGSFLGVLTLMILPTRGQITASGVLLLGCEIAVLLVPSMALGTTFAFVEWWNSNQKLSNWISPVDHWWQTIRFGVYAGTTLVMLFGPIAAMAYWGNSLSALTFQLLLMGALSWCLSPPFLIAGGFMVSVVTVLPTSAFFSPIQRQLWQNLARLNRSEV
jgi:hypothetical protein